MFLFDMAVMLVSTTFWYAGFGLPENLLDMTVLITVLSGIAVLFLKDNYKIREFNTTLKNYYLLFEGMVFAQIPPAILLLTFTHDANTFEFILANLITIFIALRIYRILFHYYLFHIKRTQNVLIIGNDKNAKLIADEITAKKALKMQVVGFIEDTESEDYIPESSLKVLTKPANLKQAIKTNNVDIVIIAIKRRMEEELLTNMVESIPENVKVYKMAEFYEKITGKYFIDRMSINWLFYDYMQKRSALYDFCKRAFDIISALIILIVTLPITGFTALRIWMTDKENPIYTQTRIGINGKEFKCYKLRTMWSNNYHPKDLNKGGYAENQEQDDRVIPWCKFIRKARFDEIPQMINILKGEMSIVGPRAEWDEVVKIYKKQIPYYGCRMWVKTGWTGWAQINQGHIFSADDELGKLVYDLYYIKHRNILWEIAILIKAIFLALGGRHG